MFWPIVGLVFAAILAVGVWVDRKGSPSHVNHDAVQEGKRRARAAKRWGR
ncbi:hypothetical protein P5P86_16990 [Nocardioides sp. BP30]|nr:hypothetical protein [Nocardioides sp. BP30]WGL51644.1 hypothetical protein P5P86_16990 [Nocardioides sp. BP30]